MLTIEDPKEMQNWSSEVRENKKTISFVPTMGALHEGHLSLLRKGRELADKLVLSIFVNPIQFGLNEDLQKYPRDLEGDLQKAKNCGVDVVFLPKREIIYPPGFQTYVDVEELSKGLCGGRRSGHFRGVATVVLKLFNLVSPHFALFGEKDYQQLKVIQKMVEDFDLPIQIIPIPIFREPDGLAMSSRNQYLSEKEREIALLLQKSLKTTQNLVKQGEKNIATLLEKTRSSLEFKTEIKVDYIELCDPETLKPLEKLKLPALLAIACFVGKTRLIDNCILTGK